MLVVAALAVDSLAVSKVSAHSLKVSTSSATSVSTRSGTASTLIPLPFFCWLLHSRALARLSSALARVSALVSELGGLRFCSEVSFAAALRLGVGASLVAGSVEGAGFLDDRVVLALDTAGFRFGVGASVVGAGTSAGAGTVDDRRVLALVLVAVTVGGVGSFDGCSVVLEVFVAAGRNPRRSSLHCLARAKAALTSAFFAALESSTLDKVGMVGGKGGRYGSR